jgi:hypothetical protein
VSEENVAIVKSSWAGWRQGLRTQMVRDFGDGVADRIAQWAESTGNPDLQPEEFVDNGDEVLVRARARGGEEPLTFRYTMSGPKIVGWDVLA